MFWDGIFQLSASLKTVLGIALLFGAGRRRKAPWSGRLLSGAVLAGWGLFRWTEGLIDH